MGEGGGGDRMMKIDKRRVRKTYNFSTHLFLRIYMRLQCFYAQSKNNCRAQSKGSAHQLKPIQIRLIIKEGRPSPTCGCEPA